MRVLIFSTILSETFTILRATELDIIVNVHWTSCKVILLLSDYSETSIYSTDFQKKSNYKFNKNTTAEAKFFHTDRQTDAQRDRHDEANNLRI
jgi:hypothetical protein